MTPMRLKPVTPRSREKHSTCNTEPLYEGIMSSLQGAIKWSHEGFRYIRIDIDIYLSKRIFVLYR